MVMAVIMAVLLKGFIIEAFRIPTGSMQPTLIGSDAMEVYDRILVDKLSFAFRDPERFEVVVFRYPLDRSKTFVKRIAGIGPEQFRIHHGDLWHRTDEGESWSVLRRPRDAQASAWLDVEPFEFDRPAWNMDGEGSWDLTGDGIRADSPGRAVWRPELGSILDRYWDGYSPDLLSLLERRRERGALHGVGDLRLEAEVEARRETEEVVLELIENDLTYRFHLPGPAASTQARVQIEIIAEPGRIDPIPEGVTLQDPWRLPAGEAVAVVVQNMDDLVEMQIEGEWLLSTEIAEVATVRAGAAVSIAGAGAKVRGLRLFRDIYYSNATSHQNQWTIPEGSYFFLGDNTQFSSDSREWSYERYRVAADLIKGYGPDHPAVELVDEVPMATLRANARRGENPLPYGFGLPDGSRIQLRDEWGELHDLNSDSVRRLTPENSPFVPRELILGRAVAVFWPLNPRRGIYRHGWIR